MDHDIWRDRVQMRRVNELNIFDRFKVSGL